MFIFAKICEWPKCPHIQYWDHLNIKLPRWRQISKLNAHTSFSVRKGRWHFNVIAEKLVAGPFKEGETSAHSEIISRLITWLCWTAQLNANRPIIPLTAYGPHCSSANSHVLSLWESQPSSAFYCPRPGTYGSITLCLWIIFLSKHFLWRTASQCHRKTVLSFLAT